ncbi:GNAT family N-acetyltransferase [Cellulomonas marina]|uniref:Acetyltransferase (GNAT) family protein n=1 Tax=Cellulomonas marina TaxID=988821 RepID=A0A1I0Z311_9CELL|nr:GNAT family N-acetyltransferase [Cellulomonas marina]GIG28149.1 N-acetyltransferase [Cellulomonas marina]SFB19010.1 Acetyltransferase (GNAT) family protein [Cellulomonas marina]
MTTSTTSTGAGAGRRTGAAADVLVEEVPWDDPATAHLRAEQEAELAARYGGADPAVAGEAVLLTLRLLVAGEPVGCVAVRDVSAEHGPGTGELKRLYVRPDHRRRGLSRLLLAAAEAGAAARGLHRLVLETGTRQPELLALYAATGWTAITPYGEHAGHPMSRCFAKRLTGGTAATV